VHRRWRRLAAVAGALGAEPSDQALHRVRILAKRCRYAAEAAAPVVGRRMGRFAAAIEEVQDLLGSHQDAVVAEAWLRAAATPDDALAAGELIVMQRLERDRLRDAWPATWAAASAPKLRRWR
jgi:CHAD domain-containing protein